MISYSTWCDRASGTYEVVRWIRQHGYGEHEVVQRNIPTKAKAIEARNTWRMRQRLHDLEAMEAKLCQKI